MLRIDCTGLTLTEGRELSTYLELINDVSKVAIDLDLGEMQTRSIQNTIPHFHLLVHTALVGGSIAGGGLVVAAGKGAAEELGKDVYKAVKTWMGRFTDKSVASVEVKLYGADGKLIETLNKRR